MTKILKALAISAIACIGLTAVAEAHPALESTVPASDKGGTPSPGQVGLKQIRLRFSEYVMAKFSGLDLRDKDGRKIATEAPATDPTDPKQLVVPLIAPLSPGRYTVTWHAVSADTHRVKGEYTFTIAP